MLALSELTLSHFRSHRSTRISLDPRPVALFGPNGAGKTNVLEAISLLSPGRGMRRATAAEMMRRPELIGWKIRATITAPARVHEIETWAEPDAPRNLLIDDKPSPQVALARIARIVWLVPAMDRLWIEGAEGRRRFLDRIAMGFAPDHAESALTYERTMRERNRLLRDGGNAHWFAALESQMAESGAEIIANRERALQRISAAQAGAQTAFPVARLAIEGDEASTPQALAHAFAESRRQDMVAGRTLIGPHRADLAAVYAEKDAPARECSTGEQKALLVSLVLANARALAADFRAPPILLLDEVAAHLDADRRAALYDEITALGSQAWITGTDRELFEPLGDRARFLAVSDDAQGSVVRDA